MPLTGKSVIYGGSFNPPHVGHQIACMWMMEALNAKEIIVTPTYKHAFGKELVSFEHRMKMCNLMCSLWADPEFPESPGNVWACDVEKELPLPNITLNTVKYFVETGRQVAVAIGSDLVHDLDEWTGWNEVMELAEIVVIGRVGSNRTPHDYPMYEYPVDLSAVSSSQVRSMVRRDMDITGLVTKLNKEYIKEAELYE